MHRFWSSCGSATRIPKLQSPSTVVFHGITVNKEDIILDGSEAPVRIDAEALLSLENLVPAAVLNKVRIPYCPVDAKLSTLSAERDRLPSGKQTLALVLTYKFKFEEGAEIKPLIPLLNNRIYDNKFESQFYMISDTNKVRDAKIRVLSNLKRTTDEERSEWKKLSSKLKITFTRKKDFRKEQLVLEDLVLEYIV